MDQDKFIKDWLEGKVDPDKLNRSGKDQDIEKLTKELDGIVNKSNQLEVPSKKTKSQAWDDLMNKIEDHDIEGTVKEELKVEKATKTFSIGKYIPIGIAASLLILAIAYFLTPRELAIQSERGQQLSHTLPDGSKIILNADSEITYSKSSYDNNREVNLKGEAFFEVEPGKRFIVVGEHGSVEVLGTSFNAYFRADKMTVSCFTGKVLVKRGNTNQNLSQGQTTKSNTSENLTQPISFDTKKIASWRSGEFFYDQTPLSEVLSELERQFNIKIEYTSSEDRIYNGYFNNKDLDEALQLVLRAMALDYSLEGNKVIVK